MTDSTLFDGGSVFTGLRYAESLLVEDGRVVAVGTADEVRRRTPTGAERRSLDGRLVIPGLIDAHLHLPDLVRQREGLDVGGVRSVEELLAAVRAWATGHPTGSIVARGWDPERSATRVWPTREDLDRVARDRPVIVVHTSAHAGVTNSAALERAGIGPRSPDPAGGRIGRGADGMPDGRVYEGALGVVLGAPEERTVPDVAALARTLRWCASFGLTTVGAMSVAAEEATRYREMASVGALPVRVRAYLRGASWQTSPHRPPDSPDPLRFQVVGVKSFADGAFGTRTAWLTEPYTDEPGNSGLPVVGAEELAQLAAEAGAHGLAPAIHAIGDRAVGAALDVLGRPRAETRAPARIEHAALTPPATWPELDRVRPVLVVQPGFVWTDDWLSSRLGVERARWAYAFRSLLGHGLLLAGSSDAPCDPVDPWRGLRAAVHRLNPAGRSANGTPEEALTPERALQLYTANGGVALGAPGLGTLEAGAPADLLVTAVPTLGEALRDGAAAVRETWVGGVRLASEAGGQTV